MIQKSPCARDCPERSAECHGSCERYLAYHEANLARIEARAKDVAANAQLTDMTLLRIGRVARRKNALKRGWHSYES